MLKKHLQEDWSLLSKPVELIINDDEWVRLFIPKPNLGIIKENTGDTRSTRIMHIKRLFTTTLIMNNCAVVVVPIIKWSSFVEYVFLLSKFTYILNDVWSFDKHEHKLVLGRLRKFDLFQNSKNKILLLKLLFWYKMSSSEPCQVFHRFFLSCKMNDSDFTHTFWKNHSRAACKNLSTSLTTLGRKIIFSTL